MAREEGKILEVFSQSDIPDAARELLRDTRVDAIVARGTFLDVPTWQHKYGTQNPEATTWINGQTFSHPSTDVLRSWIAEHYRRRIPGVGNAWEHDKRAGTSIGAHLDYLRPHKTADIVGGLSMSICTEGSGTFFAEKLAGHLAYFLNRPPILVPGKYLWAYHRTNAAEIGVQPRSAIEHEAGDGIIFASYPHRTVHSVIADEMIDGSRRRAELFDHRLYVPQAIE